MLMWQFGDTALHHALKNRSNVHIELLLEAGANVWIRNKVATASACLAQ